MEEKYKLLSAVLKELQKKDVLDGLIIIGGPCGCIAHQKVGANLCVCPIGDPAVVDGSDCLLFYVIFFVLHPNESNTLSVAKNSPYLVL